MMKKLLSVLLVLMLCVFAVSAGAQTLEKDGLKITLAADKASYAEGDTINLTLSVENAGTAVVKGIRTEYVLPGVCLSAGDDAVREISMLEAGKKATLKAAFVVGAGDDVGDLPNTGDDSSLLLWVVALGISGLAFAKLSRRAQRRVMALLLCAVTAGGVMLCSIDAASAEDDPVAIELPGHIPSHEECQKMYELLLSKAGTNPGYVLDSIGRSVTLTEEIEIMGRKTEVTVTVEYSNPANEEYTASYVKDSLENRPLSQTIGSTSIVYIQQIGPGVALPESDHYYGSNTDETYVLVGDGYTNVVTICLSADSQTESNFDALLVYDGGGNYYTTLTGTALKNAVIHVPGDRAYLRLVSDYSVNYYGFKVQKAVANPFPKLTEVANDGNGNLKLNWTTPYGYEGYFIERALVSGGTAGGYSRIVASSTVANSYLDTGVTEGQLYSYRYAPTFSYNGRTYYYTESRDVWNYVLRKTKLTGGTASENKITLKWNAVPYATSYEVYRSATENGGYTMIGTSSTTTYVDTLPSRSVYYYRVRPAATVYGTTYYSARSGAQRYGYVSLTAPSYLNGFSIAYNAVRLRWPSVEGAQKYEIYSSTRRNGTYTKVAETNLLTLAVPAQKGCYNFYKIRAYTVQDGRKVYSPYSRIYRIWPLAKPNTMHTITDENGAMTLQWKKIEGARQYTIYYSQSGRSGTFVELGTTTRASMSLASLPKDWSSCYIQIIAHRTDDGVRSRSAFSVAYRTVLNLKPPTNVAAYGINSSRLSVKWNAAANATGYEVYGSTSENGSYTKLGSTSATGRNVSALRSSGVNYIKVRTYVKQTNKVLTSAFSEPQLVFPLAAPTGLSASSNSTGDIVFRWKAVPNAQRYRVYYSSSTSGPFTEYGTTGSTSMTLSNLPGMTTVILKVVAERTDNGVVSRSSDSKQFAYLMDTMTLRALYVFIEKTYGGTDMYVSDGDMSRLRSMFSKASPYGKYLSSSNTEAWANASNSSLKGLIRDMADRADSNDVTVFYLACHGVNSIIYGEQAGQLCLYGTSRMNFSELAYELNKIPGKVVIFLASCGSGAAIAADADGEAVAFDEDEYIDEFIDVFAEMDKQYMATASVEEAHGELRVPNKFYVVATCRPGESGFYVPGGYSVIIDWMYGGVVGTSGGYMKADRNRDNTVTLAEMYTYLNGAGNVPLRTSSGYAYMYPQVYPTGSSFPLFQLR